MEQASLALQYRAASSASVADATTIGRMELMMWMAPLCGGCGSPGLGDLVGSGRESERIKCLATRDLALVSEW